MSVVSMKKMSLVAHSCERSKLLRIFIKNGCVEFVKNGTQESTLPDERIAELEAKRFKVSFAMNFLKENLKNAPSTDKKKPKINLKRTNRLVAYEEYQEVAEEEVEILSKIADMERMNNRIADIRSEKNRLNATVAQISAYRGIAIPFGAVRDTEKTFSLLGTVDGASLSELEKLPAEAEVETGNTADKTVAVLVIAHKSKKEDVLNVLSACDFVRASFDFQCSASEEIERLEGLKKDLETESKTIAEGIVRYLAMTESLKILYDYYSMEIEKCHAVGNCEKTQKTIVMEGWVPADKEKKITEAIVKNCPRAEVEFRDPSEEEVPPTLTRNNKTVSAFDGITDMFGAPNYRERDPKLFVALYYFLIFGFMLGDAGYGLIMAIACFAFTAWKKPVKNSGQMMIMFAFCGISTFLWGALFGGWFGTTFSFMDKYHLYWFKPLDEPLLMFAVSLGVGMLQIGTGFALHGIATIEQGGIKNIVLGITKDFGWVILICGAFLFSPSLLAFLGIIDEITPAVATLVEVGKYVTLVGAAMMLLSGIVGKKNPVKALGGVFGNAYGAINVVSDLLSYSRLFGLGLTSGVIGYVVNMLADIIVDTFCGGTWFGWLIAVPVLIIGHVFNLAINLLGAYVHDSRLQYIEFFGRFYDGSGHAFRPIGSSVQYTFLDN